MRPRHCRDSRTGRAFLNRAEEDLVMRPVVVFDMDGVLVDVGDSYRETICRTVEHFTGRPVTREMIQDYKNQGGWNNDWALSQKMAYDLGVDILYERVVEHFQKLFLG